MRTRYATFLTCFALFACLAPVARAEGGAPPPAPAPAPTAQQPAPPAPAPPAPAPEARKEEEAEKAKASLLARLRGYLKGTGAMANDIAGLQQENADLRARNKALEDGTEIKALRDENASMRADIAEFMAVAQSHGLFADSPAAAPKPLSPMGQAAAQVVAGAVGNQLAAIGVPVATIPPANPADAPAATLAEVEEQLKACTSDRERQNILAKYRKLIMSAK